jgi:hypothetical protein
MRKQVAVYWAPGPPDAFGQPTWEAPEELTCRWEDKVVEFLPPAGERKQSMALVYVESDVELKGKLKLGALTSATPADPTEDEDAWEILRFEKLPNFRNTEYLRTVYL